jgi:rhodanese-related sulfurtransferase
MPDLFARVQSALASRYPIEREIGRGGMAAVFLASDPRHRRRVAVKVLGQDLASLLGPERFLREIELAAGLSHPHILPLYDSGEVDGLLYYVMPFIDGESLRERLDRERHLPIEDAVAVARKVAGALDYAHRRGVVHRDIKPENILLHEGEPLVADFGIALAPGQDGAPRLTGTGMSVGTPYYMSPEQATGERNVDARTDIYSLGCVLFEMLAGEPPHTGPSGQAVLARMLTEPPRSLRSVRPGAPPALERALESALARLPADRFPTASAFADSLARIEANEPAPAPTRLQRSDPALDTGAGPVAPPAASAPSPGRWRRSAPWTVAALALVVAVAGWWRAGGLPVALAGDELTTEQFRQVLAADEAVVLDTRPHLEYAISHIPGARNVAARPGIPMSMYESDVAEVSRILGGNLSRAIVLYCNGPLCPKSKRLAGELTAAGFTNIRRYQLGIPVWRAFGGVTVIEPDGLRHVLAKDGTAVVVDARDIGEFRAGSLPGARNIPRNRVLDARDVGELRAAKDDGRLPMTDHNTRIVVVGRTPGEARFVAQAIALEAFHNVSYFPGSFAEARAALARPQ